MERLRSSVLFLVLLNLATLTLVPRTAAADAPSKEEILRTLGKADLIGDATLKLEVKAWNSIAGSFVALMYIERDEVVRTEGLEPTLAVLKVSEHGIEIIARAAIKADACRRLAADEMALARQDDGTSCTEMRLDLAPYRISPSETALGVRTKVHAVYPAGESDEEALTLFAIKGDTLKPIFSHDMASEASERGPNDMITSSSKLRVTDHQTAGHFDLLLIERIQVEELVHRDDDARPKDRSERTERRRFVWRGDGYRETK
jgi:hypothetical protein